MRCCLCFRSVLRARGPRPKRYFYHVSILLQHQTHEGEFYTWSSVFFNFIKPVTFVCCVFYICTVEDEISHWVDNWIKVETFGTSTNQLRSEIYLYTVYNIIFWPLNR